MSASPDSKNGQRVQVRSPSRPWCTRLLALAVMASPSLTGCGGDEAPARILGWEDAGGTTFDVHSADGTGGETQSSNIDRLSLR